MIKQRELDLVSKQLVRAKIDRDHFKGVVAEQEEGIKQLKLRKQMLELMIVSEGKGVK